MLQFCDEYRWKRMGTSMWERPYCSEHCLRLNRARSAGDRMAMRALVRVGLTARRLVDSGYLR